MKFAFVSQTMPPSWSGQSVMIHRLLYGLNPEDYCLVVQDYGDKAPQKNYACEKLPGKYYVLPAWLQLRRGWSFSVVKWINITLRALQIARILRREKCAAVVASTGDLFDMPAAYYAGRLMGVKFYPYLFDDYSHKAVGTASAFAHRIEPVMLKGASAIIVPNEFLRDGIRSRYGVESKVIHNPCDLSDYGPAPHGEVEIGKGDEVRIVYTGSIYEAHYDAVRNMAAAIELLPQRNVRLHLYTDQSAAELEKHGIRGPITLHSQQSVSAVPEIQRQADILFLPLSFGSPYPEIIRTSAPGKTGEYLASGRPVLVHAPADSFLAWYFRRHDCGVVVDEDDAKKLASAIEWLLTDADLRHRLVGNGWQRAQADFSIAASQTAFTELMELSTPEVKREQALC
jgi:glycosyltransferase involved in cell wall biosynthesis